MNRFAYKSTAVTKSEFDLTKLKRGEKLDGSAEVTVAIGIPKDPETNRTVRCKIAMKIAGENNEYQCYIQTASDFTITDLTDPETLVKDPKRWRSCPNGSTGCSAFKWGKRSVFPSRPFRWDKGIAQMRRGRSHRPLFVSHSCL